MEFFLLVADAMEIVARQARESLKILPYLGLMFDEESCWGDFGAIIIVPAI